MPKTRYRTPVTRIATELTARSKGHATRLAIGLLGAAAIGLPLIASAQPADAAMPGAPSASSAPLQLDPIQAPPLTAQVDGDAASSGFPRTAAIKNNQASFDRLVRGTPGAGSADRANPRETATSEAADVPWALATSAHPWPLRVYEPGQVTNLVLQVPSERDARIMLPGVAINATEHARFTANKYIVDAIGVSAQARGRQLEEISTWVERTLEQQNNLDANDPWQAYQFRLEAHRSLMEFKAQISAQAEPSIAVLAQQIRQAIDQISPVMAATESYELRMAWYNVMVLLKEGLTLYQTQTYEADAQIMAQIEAFSKTYPKLAQPDGPLPLTVEQAQAKRVAAANAASLAPALPAQVTAQSVRSPAPDAVNLSSGSSLTGSLIVTLVALLTGGGLFFAVRRRFSKKSPSANVPT